MENTKLIAAIEWLNCLKFRSDISLGETGYEYLEILIRFFDIYKGGLNEKN